MTTVQSQPEVGSLLREWRAPSRRSPHGVYGHRVVERSAPRSWRVPDPLLRNFLLELGSGR